MSNGKLRKQATNKVEEYSLVGIGDSKFQGYNARTDGTTIGNNWLVSPSQNVMIGVSGRVGSVAGYTLDGTGSTTIDSGILSSYDFTNFKGDVRNMRAGFMSAAANDGKLQYRYKDKSGNVSWNNLSTKLSSITLSFCDFWDTTNLIKWMLWVDGTSNIYAWNGAVTTLATSNSSTTLDKQGLYTNTTITFNNGTSQILDSSNNFLIYGFKTGDIITVTGSQSNNNTFTIINATAGTLTVNGATPVFTETSGNSITVAEQNSTTWQQEGFTPTGSIRIFASDGTYSDISYTGGYATQTLTGLSGIPSFPAGTVIIQTPVTTAFSAMTSILVGLPATVIGCGARNQVYVGSSQSNNVYISKVNTYTDYSFTTPTRVVGEGWLEHISAPPTKFISQEAQEGILVNDLYISYGLSGWGKMKFTLSSDNTKESATFVVLKDAPLQGTISERLCTKMKNYIMYIANDKTANFLGYESYQNVPVIRDFSFPIVNDMNSYNFAAGSIFYHKNFVYIAIPEEGIVRVYNMTDQTKSYSMAFLRPFEEVEGQPWFWESPITYPISGFYIVNGELYGHSYTTSESYKLFTGGSFNGQDIETNATFGFDDKGDRTSSKVSDECWIEGYIGQNTKLNVTIGGDLDFFNTQQTVIIDGSDKRIVAYGGGGHSLGQVSLGTLPLGGSLQNQFVKVLPAWFHVAKTYPMVPSYLEQLSFTAKGVDLDWELITFGTNSKFTAEGNNYITI